MKNPIRNRVQSKKWQLYNAHTSSYGTREEFPVIANYTIDKTASPKMLKNEGVWALVLLSDILRKKVESIVASPLVEVEPQESKRAWRDAAFILL